MGDRLKLLFFSEFNIELEAQKKEAIKNAS